VRLVFRASVSFNLRGAFLIEDNIKNAFRNVFFFSTAHLETISRRPCNNSIFSSIGARSVEVSMERDVRTSSLSLEPRASELESVGMIFHPAKASHSRQNIPLDSRYGRMFGVRNK
jgi:hypothetical protein